LGILYLFYRNISLGILFSGNIIPTIGFWAVEHKNPNHRIRKKPARWNSVATM
jgi:hypothetical protein